MKKTIYTLLGLLLAAGLTSCQDWFIEKPEVTGMDQDEVFSTAKNAEGAIAEAYATILSSGLPVLVWNNSPIMPYETTEAIMGGEDLCRLTWGYMDKQVVAGMLANNENNGAGYTDDYFPNNYAYIRKAWLVYENIDKVADMSDRDKAIVKAEMQVLVAFRYVEMLKRYGGVPLVESTLTTVDVRPRSTVQQTLDFIVGLCDAAAATLEGVRWPADWLGRVNKGVALAVKAEALMYAARPLFNADAPYMQMADPANNEMIWLGGYDAKRWETARLANQEVIDWGKANGFELIDTGDPIKDYGTAVGTPSNREVLLAYKQQREADDNGIYKNYTFMPTHTGHDLGQYRGTGYGQLCQYRKADGTDQTWACAGVALFLRRQPQEQYRQQPLGSVPELAARIQVAGRLCQEHQILVRSRFARMVRIPDLPHGGVLPQYRRGLQRGGQPDHGAALPERHPQARRHPRRNADRPGGAAAEHPPRMGRGEPVVSPRPPLEAGGVDGRRGQVQVRVLAGRRRVVEPPQTRGVRQLHAQALLCPRIHVARAHVPFALYAQRGE